MVDFLFDFDSFYYPDDTFIDSDCSTTTESTVSADCYSTTKNVISTDLILFNKHNEINKINFENSIDEKIIEICENIFNNEFNKIHRYNDMNKFLNNCIKLSQDLLELIQRVSKLICENTNYYCTNNDLFKSLKEIIDKFKSNCESIIYFYQDEGNIIQLNDFYTLLSINFNSNLYTEEDFKNSEFLYSNVQLSWNLIIFNLELYKDDKQKQFRKIKYPQQKSIENNSNPFKFITDFFTQSSSKKDLVLKNNNKNHIKHPIIENVITFNGENYSPSDFNNKLITSN